MKFLFEKNKSSEVKEMLLLIHPSVTESDNLKELLLPRSSR